MEFFNKRKQFGTLVSDEWDESLKFYLVFKLFSFFSISFFPFVSFFLDFGL